MNKRLTIVSGVACGLLVLGGCAGPKMMSQHVSQSRVWQPIPAQQPVWIASSSRSYNEGQTHKLRQDLTSELPKSGVFAEVEGPDAKAGDGVQMYVEVTDVQRAGWWSRAFLTGSTSSVQAEGKVVSSDDTVLATISEVRSGPGGIIGAGGWLTCGEATMVNTLTKWVAQDIADSLQKTPRSEAKR